MTDYKRGTFKWPRQLNPIIGLHYEAAKKWLATNTNCVSLRVVYKDGKAQLVKGDILPTRINVAVVNGVITEIIDIDGNPTKVINAEQT